MWEPGRSVTVTVPASSANLGPGFDAIGVGLDIRDRCTVTITQEAGIRVAATGEGADAVPTDERHLVVRSLLRGLDALGVDRPGGMTLSCVNAVPHGRGLGSSATAIVAGVGAASALAALAAGGPAAMDLAFVNDLAAEMEGHPDNSSASVYGGLTLSWPDDAPETGPLAHTRTVCLTPHPAVRPIVVCPDTQLSTATARSVLPSQVLLRDAAANSARAALLVHALTTDPQFLLPATRDWLHQEARRPSYAASMALVDRLRAAGHAAVISGAGPSVLVLTTAPREVVALADGGWRVLDPGFATTGIALVSAVSDA